MHGAWVWWWNIAHGGLWDGDWRVGSTELIALAAAHARADQAPQDQDDDETAETCR